MPGILLLSRHLFQVKQEDLDRISQYLDLYLNHTIRAAQQGDTDWLRLAGPRYQALQLFAKQSVRAFKPRDAKRFKAKAVVISEAAADAMGQEKDRGAAGMGGEPGQRQEQEQQPE